MSIVNVSSMWRSLCFGQPSRGGHGGLRPDREVQNAELDRLFIDSDGVTTFVGEWHSHPLARAVPSKRDRKTLRNTVTDPESATTVALMLILERDDDETWSAVGWTGHLGRLGRIGRLEVTPVHLRVFGGAPNE